MSTSAVYLYLGCMLAVIYFEFVADGKVVSEDEATIMVASRITVKIHYPAVATLASGESLAVECDSKKKGEGVILQHYKSLLLKRSVHRCKE